jgi:hypothetical protein
MRGIRYFGSNQTTTLNGLLQFPWLFAPTGSTQHIPSMQLRPSPSYSCLVYHRSNLFFNSILKNKNKNKNKNKTKIKTKTKK